MVIVVQDGSFAGTQTFEHSGSTDFRPAAHYQRRTGDRNPALPQGIPTAPTAPQGNHLAVVVLDAINGLVGKVDSMGYDFCITRPRCIC